MPDVRMRTASDKKKAMAQYDELRRAGRVERAVVIAELKDGSWQVLGQGMSPEQIAGALMVGAEALAAVEAKGRELRPEPHIEPERRGERNLGRVNKPEITKDAEGVLVPPKGENFISCGECAHPHWFVLHHNNTEQMSRMACSHCGNEVINRQIFHEEGHA
jgi:hypothetical protein